MISRRSFLTAAGSVGIAGALTKTEYVAVDTDGPTVSVMLPGVPELTGRNRSDDGTSATPELESKKTEESGIGNLFSDEWDADATARVAHEAVNQERISNQLSTLAWDEELHSIAESYAKRMAQEGFFAHTDPQGNDFSDRYAEAGYQCRVDVSANQYTTGGENIAQTWWERQVDTGSGTVFYSEPEELGQGVVEQWMNSPGHRRNILRDFWNNEGIGIAKSDDDKVYAVQNFC